MENIQNNVTEVANENVANATCENFNAAENAASINKKQEEMKKRKKSYKRQNSPRLTVST